MRNLIIKLFFIAFGASIAGFALECFLIPNNMIDGGIVGVSIMASYLLKLNLGALIIAINTPFIFLALKKLGKVFVAQTIYAVAVLGLSVNIFHGHQATNDLLLATVFGGIALGIGVGIVLRHNAAMDGTEILAIRIVKKIGFSIGEIIMFFNIFIFGAAGFLYGIDRAMYSVLAYFIAYKVIDIVIEGFNESKSVNIISDKSQEIGDALIRHLDLGITYIQGRGGFSGVEKNIIFCVISRLELAQLKEIVKSIDPMAFLSVENVHEVEGVRVKERKASKNFTRSVYKLLVKKRKKS